MEPTFFKTPGSSGHGARQRMRRFYQAVAAVVVLALMGVALWAVLHRKPADPKPDDTSLLVAKEEGLKAAIEKKDGDAGKTSSADGQTQPAPKVNLTAEELATEGHIPAAPAAADSASGDARRELEEKYAQAEAALARQELLKARALFNEVVDRGLPTATNAKCIERLARLADQTLMTSVRVPGDPATDLFRVPPGGVLIKIGQRFKVPYRLLERINNVQAPKLKAHQTIKVINGPFNAVVDKSDFTLTVYLDIPPAKDQAARPTLIRRYRVGLGEYNSTPTGVFVVSNVAKYPRYTHPRTGQSIAPGAQDYPFGKLGLWIAMKGVAGKALTETGYGIHSTNEPETIGKQASLGCVRMLDPDAEELVRLLRAGSSRVTVRE